MTDERTEVGLMKSVEIINNGNGTYSLRVFDTIVLTGSLEECKFRAQQEAE